MYVRLKNEFKQLQERHTLYVDIIEQLIVPFAAYIKYVDAKGD